MEWSNGSAAVPALLVALLETTLMDRRLPTRTQRIGFI